LFLGILLIVINSIIQHKRVKSVEKKKEKRIKKASLDLLGAIILFFAVAVINSAIGKN